jgi:hypothetical protein
MQYTVDYFIDKFEKIPEEKWLVGSQGYDNSAHCAIGWCKNRGGAYGDANITHPQFTSYSEEALHLANLIAILPIEQLQNINGGWNVAYLNNGKIDEYQQPTPRARILAALYDIKNMQQRKDITSELAVLPVNETSDIKTTEYA